MSNIRLPMVYFLRTGDPGLLPAHPPLNEVLATLPLLADRNLVVPLRDAASATMSNLAYSDQLLWRLNQNGPSIVHRARLPINVLTLLLAVTVYACTRELFGPTSKLLALTLLRFDPNILALVMIILVTDRIWKSISASRSNAKTTLAYPAVIATTLAGWPDNGYKFWWTRTWIGDRT